MHEMEKEMCEAIARHNQFTAEDIYTEWLVLKSFDVILRVVNIAKTFGIASVHEAANIYIHEPKEE